MLRYTKRELQNLWGSGFAGSENEVTILSDFADSTEQEASEMIGQFRSTAAARKASEAEEKRRKRKKKEAVLKPDPDDELDPEIFIDDAFPCDSIIAAAINSEHSLSVVEAEAHSRDRTRVLCVEKVNRCGVPCHRVKMTTYRFFKSRDAALTAARQHRMKLTVYGSHK